MHQPSPRRLHKSAVLFIRPLGLAAAVLAGISPAAMAMNNYSFAAPGADKDLLTSLKGASLLQQAQDRKTKDTQDILAAARADYARLVGALYSAGYYAPVIHILVNGQEAATIPPLDTPKSIQSVKVEVQKGPLFHFSQTRIAPLAPKDKLPKNFRKGEPAQADAIQTAVSGAVLAWRGAGHAKAAPAGQKIVADHRSATLSADVTLNPGPEVRFGKMNLTGKSAVREERIRAIAGFPTGQVFDPKKEQKAADRLRKTGAFASVAMTESDTLGPGNTMDVTTAIADQKRHQLGFGAALSTSEGATLTAYWLDRNLLGGAEKLRIDAEVDGIGAQDVGIGYKLQARFDRPATFNPETAWYILGVAQRQSYDDYDSDSLSFSTGLTHEYNDHLTGSAGIGFDASRVTDITGNTQYRDVTFPLQLTYDSRDKALDAHRGIYAQVGLMPFLGLGDTGTGAKLTWDLRGYKALGSRVVLAGRIQGGMIRGSDIESTPRDYLFYSGGGGSVRGQPYQSLGVYAISPTLRTGGRNFLGLSGEARIKIRGNIGAVAFYDAGYVSADNFFDDTGGWQAGAGLGLRYNTSIGPIRLDVGFPVSGGTGEGVQIYIGIGQAF